MVYHTNKELFKQGFIIGSGYSIAVGLTFSMAELACYVYDTVKTYMNDIKELKQRKVVEELQINENVKELEQNVVEDLQVNNTISSNKSS